MTDELDTAALYRSRAVNLRTTANDQSADHIREHLLVGLHPVWVTRT